MLINNFLIKNILFLIVIFFTVTFFAIGDELVIDKGSTEVMDGTYIKIKE